jgi:CBS domain-containing protein
MDKVSDILKHKGTTVHTIEPAQSVYEAIAKMAQNNVGALVVEQAGHVVGIITERDYLRSIALKGRTSHQTTVREIMTRKVIYADPSGSVTEALSIMTDRHIRHLPVMQDDRLAGIVSIGDCVKQICRLQKVEIKVLKEYITDGYPGPDPSIKDEL